MSSFFLPLFIPAPLASLPSYLFLSCLSWYSCPIFVFLFILCFLLTFLTYSLLLCLSLHPPVRSRPTARCLPASEEAPSPSSCPESICGSGSSFSPPSCARTSVSSRRLRQVGLGVLVWSSPGPHVAQLPSTTQPLPSPAPTGSGPRAASLSSGPGWRGSLHWCLQK